MQERHAVVVGAGGGIGRECTRQLRARGWRVFGLDLNRLETDDPGVMPLICDVTDAGDVQRAFAEIGRTAPAINALIVCSGILKVGALEDMAIEAFDAIFSVNVRGPFLCARAAAPMLRAAASADYPSRIVFLSSVAALRPKIHGGAYAATKAALDALTRTFAGELAPGVLVNGIAPGAVDTDFVRKMRQGADAGDSYKAGGSTLPPLGRIATPADVAAVMNFLLDPGANHMLGAIITMDGGASAVRM
ncbi:SDR family oxidoreductase [Pigmentiphaga soli]|uniref:SDR family oxidoreductase n=1 Tax=Pigmentiphaga soli TaxID=1007095 RepID=A0ABP8HDN6_9BURK